MTKTYLLMDVPNLAYKALHTQNMGELANKGKPVGVIFGVLRDILYLRDRFAANTIVLCFDDGVSKRKQLFPGYKMNRNAQEYTPDCNFKNAKKQIRMLKEELLEELGFANVLYQEGYEADDIIASICREWEHRPKGTIIIVSSDHDLFQCLDADLYSDTILQWLPQQKKLVNVQTLANMGTCPGHWARVKAIAGCKSDGIPGVNGVGETLAIRYVMNQLPTRYKAFHRIEENRDLWNKNLELTELPFPGCPDYPTLRTDNVTKDKWDTVCRRFGFTSLIGKW